MSRYGPMFGPDITFLGVERCDVGDPATYADADVVIIGAPFDGGTSNRPGARFGPMALRQACYLPHDGSRPSLALRVDALRDLRVLDAGDVECYSGDVEVRWPRSRTRCTGWRPRARSRWCWAATTRWRCRTRAAPRGPTPPAAPR
ncbi:arginase family protein [Nonomuraea sp. NPDC049725]|uniref:arginase family protein n=1 Tax=Nonomuraea sp. NPDC049725 TaxID=3154508 RepID=UPI003423192B